MFKELAQLLTPATWQRLESNGNGRDEARPSENHLT